jgi:hypothetical protein
VPDLGPTKSDETPIVERHITKGIRGILRNCQGEIDNFFKELLDFVGGNEQTQ